MTERETQERSWLARELGAPRALVVLAAIHSVASWLGWLDRYEDLSQEPLTVFLAISGLLGVWGLLLVWVMVLVVLWKALFVPLATRMQGQGRSTVSFLQRAVEHLGVWLALLAFSYLLGLVVPNVRLMLWLFCALWLLGFGATGSWMLLVDALRPESQWLPRERTSPPRAC